jgi:hypothetical protein
MRITYGEACGKCRSRYAACAARAAAVGRRALVPRSRRGAIWAAAGPWRAANLCHVGPTSLLTWSTHPPPLSVLVTYAHPQPIRPRFKVGDCILQQPDDDASSKAGEGR